MPKSEVTELTCTGCSACGKHLHPHFNLSGSATGDWIRCGPNCPGKCQKDSIGDSSSCRLPCFRAVLGLMSRRINAASRRSIWKDLLFKGVCLSGGHQHGVGPRPLHEISVQPKEMVSRQLAFCVCKRKLGTQLRVFLQASSTMCHMKIDALDRLTDSGTEPLTASVGCALKASLT